MKNDIEAIEGILLGEVKNLELSTPNEIRKFHSIEELTNKQSIAIFKWHEQEIKEVRRKDVEEIEDKIRMKCAMFYEKEGLYLDVIGEIKTKLKEIEGGR